MSGAATKPPVVGREPLDILLVEDNRDDIELTLRALRRQAPERRVGVAGDGQEALEFLFAQGRYAELATLPPPQLVLLDIDLPKLDGIEVLRRLREHPRSRLLPVVVLSSSGRPEELCRSYAAGANSYVRKPIDPGDFARALERLARYWLGLNLAPGNGP